jgi:DNA-nicking Smr family endonuclease
MAGRRLSPEEQALWKALAKTVRPLRRVRPKPAVVEEIVSKSETLASPPPPRVRGRVPPARKPDPPTVQRPAPVPVLDSSWEKKIRGGRLVPDLSVDLHGLNLAAAHLRLDRLLGEAIMSDARVLLVVTGKPRSHRPLPGENGKRGAIRAEIGDWLARSPYAGRIASVRAAHLRHGGEGALYIILRRPG